MVKARNSPKNKNKSANKNKAKKHPVKRGGGSCGNKAKKHYVQKGKGKDAHASKNKLKTPWMKHLMSVYNAGKAQGQSFAQAMKAAKKTYKK